jgi:hypothetical protein
MGRDVVHDVSMSLFSTNCPLMFSRNEGKENLLFPDKQVPRFTFHSCAPGYRCFLPVLDIFTVMLTGKAVFTAEIPVTIFAMERKVHPLPAVGTVLMDRRFFLPEEF